MKVKYQFVNEMVEIEVDNDWSAVITELDRKERNNNKTETRRHCSFDAFDMETSFGSDTDASMEFLKKAEFKNVYATLEKLSERHRHLLTAVYMDGVSLTELAIQEGCTVAAIHYALSTARKKFKIIYQENLKKTQFRGLTIEEVINSPFSERMKIMKHSLKISVSDKPVSGGIVACRKVSLRKRVLDKLLGPEQKVTVIVPGQTVECISIKELAEGGACDE